MTQAQLVRTPFEPGVELQRNALDDTVLALAVPYALVVGKLVFLAGCTRPDIMQPVVALACIQPCHGWMFGSANTPL
jgi:hypothetical protein